MNFDLKGMCWMIIGLLFFFVVVIFIFGKSAEEVEKSKNSWALRTGTSSLEKPIPGSSVCVGQRGVEWHVNKQCQGRLQTCRESIGLSIDSDVYTNTQSYSGSYLLARCQVHFQAQCFMLPAWVIYAFARLDVPTLLAVGEMCAVVFVRRQTTPLYCSAMLFRGKQCSMKIGVLEKALSSFSTLWDENMRIPSRQNNIQKCFHGTTMCLSKKLNAGSSGSSVWLAVWRHFHFCPPNKNLTGS